MKLNNEFQNKTKMDMKYVNGFFQKTNKVFLYSSRVIFSDYKSYLYAILLPAVITFIIFAIQTDLFSTAINQNTFPVIFLVPSIILIVLFSKILLDWRKSTFIKQMKNLGINKYSFVLGFTSTTLLCSLMSSAIGILYIYLFSFISVKGQNSFNDWARFVTNGTQVVGLIMSILFSSLMSSVIAILFTGYLRNIYIIQAFNIVLIIFFLVFSDILITPEVSSNIKAICIIGYFDPYKYMSWLILMFNAKMNVNFYYIYFVVVNINGYVSFTEIWQTIIGSLGFIFLVWVFSTVLFSSSTKK